MQAQYDSFTGGSQGPDVQPNWLFGTLREDESEDNLLCHHPHSARESHQQVPNAPSATNDRIKLLQMSATRRGIAAGMRL